MITPPVPASYRPANARVNRRSVVKLGTLLRFSLDSGQQGLVPLSLQSLVENSVKHAIAPRREGGEIRMAARAGDGRIELEVADTGPGFLLEAAPQSRSAPTWSTTSRSRCGACRD